MSVKSFKTSGVGVDLAPKGLVLLNTTSFSAVASQSINDVFSASYDKYVFDWSIVTSTNADINFRYRVSGSDNSTSNYYYSGLGNSWGAGTTLYYNSGSAQTLWKIFNSGAADRDANGTFTICDPFSSTRKAQITGNFAYATSGVTGVQGVVFDGTTSFTGFTIYTSTGTMTGTLAVYGKNK
jgi:hypothetical protein